MNILLIGVLKIISSMSFYSVRYFTYICIFRLTCKVIYICNHIMMPLDYRL